MKSAIVKLAKRSKQLLRKGNVFVVWYSLVHYTTGCQLFQIIRKALNFGQYHRSPYMSRKSPE